MIKRGEPRSAPVQVHVALNWREELKRRAPVGRDRYP